jgi:cytidylate kinase
MSITGDIGSGKSAVTRLLHGLTGFPVYSTGALQRRIAARHGMTTLELNRYAETHPEIDDEIDSESIRLGRTDESFIIDSRIAWHFIPHSFKVYLAVDLDVAARRILGDGERSREFYTDLETAKREIANRRRSEVERFRSIYGIDLSDLDNYDLVVDTSETSQEEIAEVVLRAFRRWARGEATGDRRG